jgi:hypothetical protein
MYFLLINATNFYFSFYSVLYYLLLSLLELQKSNQSLKVYLLLRLIRIIGNSTYKSTVRLISIIK